MGCVYNPLVARHIPLLFLFACGVWAQPVETKWRIAGVVPDPVREIALTREPPPGMKAIDGVAAQYGAIDFSGRRVGIAIDPERLWVDRNHDGKFGVKEFVTGWRRLGGREFRAAIVLPIGRGGDGVLVPLQFRQQAGRLYYGHALERAGDVELGGRLRPFILVDGDADLRFNSIKYDALVIDIDGDARVRNFPGSHERFAVRQDFRIGDSSYRCDTLSGDARRVEFSPTSALPPHPPRRLPKLAAPPAGVPANDPGGDLDKYKRAFESGRDASRTLLAAGRIGSDKAFAFLLGIARDTARTPTERAAALRAMGFAPYARHARLLERFATASAGDVEVRNAALAAMHGAGVVGRALIYASLLRDGEHPDVVGTAAQQLAYVRPRMLDPAILRLENDVMRFRVYNAARQYAVGGPRLATVLDCAGREYSLLRAQALRDLFLLGHPKALELARAAALDPRTAAPVALAAAMVLGAANDSQSLQILLELASRGVPDVVLETRRLLTRTRNDAATRMIASYLESKSPVARRLAIQILAEIPGSAAGSALVGRLGKEDSASLDTLLRLAVLRYPHPKVVSLLSKPVRRARGVEEQRIAVEALAGLGQRHAAVRAAMIESLKSSQWEVRVLTLRAIGQGPYEDLAAAVARSLRHRIWQVRLSAAEALGRLRVDTQIEALIDALEREQLGRVKKALGESLSSLTGENLRDYGELWRRWWDKQGGAVVVSLKPRSRGRSAGKNGETKTVATFYGIPVDATRIIFVLDRSGSMERIDRTDGQTRLERAKKELLRAIDGLPRTTRANIIFFGSGAAEWRPSLVPINKSNKRAVRGFLIRIAATGGTNLYDALAMALSDKQVEAIYLLSDGQPTGRFHTASEMLREIGRLNQVKRVQIHTIALGFESTLLRQLAKQNGGVYERR